MRISSLAQNLCGAWMITPDQAAVMMPVLKGILAGNIIEPSSDAEKPFLVDMQGKRYSMEAASSDEVSSEKYVYVTYLRGTMLKHDGECGEPGTRTIGQGLLKADQDKTIIGHIIVAESGGGACNSVPDLADAIQQCSKPVVTYIDGLAGSACMYAISYSDHIMAHNPMDEVGCIGVMVQLSGLPKYYKNPNTGEIYARIYATQSQDKNLDYEAALEADAKLIREESLDPLCEQFINDIQANRPAVAEEQLHGKLFFAKDAVGSLIDSIGTFEDAIAKVFELAASQTESNSSTQMAKYPQLESIVELAEQHYEEDGSTILQECQLQAIEQALTTPRAEETELRSQILSLQQSHQAEVAGLQQTISDQSVKLSQRAARISELEAALSASIALNSQEKPASVKMPADPANSSEEDAPAKNFAEAAAACREFLNKNNNY